MTLLQITYEMKPVKEFFTISQYSVKIHHTDIDGLSFFSDSRFTLLSLLLTKNFLIVSGGDLS